MQHVADYKLIYPLNVVPEFKYKTIFYQSKNLNSSRTVIQMMYINKTKEPLGSFVLSESSKLKLQIALLRRAQRQHDDTTTIQRRYKMIRQLYNDDTTAQRRVLLILRIK